MATATQDAERIPKCAGAMFRVDIVDDDTGERTPVTESTELQMLVALVSWFGVDGSLHAELVGPLGRQPVRRYQMYWFNTATGELRFFSETRHRDVAEQVVNDSSIRDGFGSLIPIMASTFSE